MLPMRIRHRLIGVLACVLPLAAASLPAAKPEEVGMSSDRLERIHEMLVRHIAAHDISGAVTMVARRGQVVHFEAHGLMDIEAKKPMTKDALFRLASSSKPITATAILMLMEEGKLKLTDPVGKYIPEFRIPRWRWRPCARRSRWRTGSRRRGAVPYGAGESRHHHHRPADAYLGAGQRRHHQCRICRSCCRRARPPRRWPISFRGWARWRWIFSRGRNGATAAWRGSTRWGGLWKSFPG